MPRQVITDALKRSLDASLTTDVCSWPKADAGEPLIRVRFLSRDGARRIADALPKAERGKLDHKALAVRWKVSSPG